MTWESRLTLEISSAPPDSTPVWVDFTDRVRDAAQLLSWGRGRQNNLDQSEPGPFEAVLENSDDALTLGNTSSPYFSWWGPGRRLRVREHIGQFTIDQYAGYLQIPEELLITARTEQYVKITAVDRLGRLASRPTFPSTLGAHIVGSGNGALVGYWSLTDAAEPFADLIGSTVADTLTLGSSVVPLEQTPAGLPQEGAIVPGDDAAPLLLRPGLNGGVLAGQRAAAVGFGPFPAFVAGQVVTAVVWINAKADYPTTGSWAAMTLTHFDGLVDVQKVDDPAGDYFRITSPLGTLTGNVSGASGSAAATDRYYMIGMRFGFTPNTLELWVDDQTYTATLSGVYAGPGAISALQVGPIGSAAHLQLYVGAASDWDHEDFLAQRAVGLGGLDRQTTGARIRSILAYYSGIPTGEYDSTVDSGTAVMAKAELAGKNPFDALREAETTEQGLLWIDGTGDVVFSDRRRLYNV